MRIKKLSLDEAKKAILIEALERAAAGLDPDLRGIYEETIAQARAARDRITLTDAQAGIVRHALDAAPRTRGSIDMLAQLRLSRREYAAIHAAARP